MNTLEFVRAERNRLVWLSIITSVIGFAFAVAARDPFLNISLPFTGTGASNITAGHIVLLGQPVLCVLFLLLSSQIYRYHRLISSSGIDDNKRKHLEWRLVCDAQDSIVKRFGQILGEIFRWFAFLAAPLITSVILYLAQFGFYYCPIGEEENRFRYYDNRHYCDEKPWLPIDLEFVFENNFRTVVASYLKLRRSQCENSVPPSGALFESRDIQNIGSDDPECQEREVLRKKILSRLPLLYQPANFLVGTLFQVPVAILFVFVSVHYFRGERFLREFCRLWYRLKP